MESVTAKLNGINTKGKVYHVLYKPCKHALGRSVLTRLILSTADTKAILWPHSQPLARSQQAQLGHSAKNGHFVLVHLLWAFTKSLCLLSHVQLLISASFHTFSQFPDILLSFHHSKTLLPNLASVVSPILCCDPSASPRAGFCMASLPLCHLSLCSTRCNLFTDIWMDLLHWDSEDIFHYPLFLPALFCLNTYLSFFLSSVYLQKGITFLLSVIDL